MGEFSYAQPDGLGYDDFSAGYGLEPGLDPGQGPSGYQDEVQALVPDGVPLLGAILLEQGVLDQPALQAAMAKQAETGFSLAQVLLDESLAAPDQLVSALQLRASYG